MEGKDAFVASAAARTRLGRLLLGGLYVREDEVRARKLLLQAASLGENNAARCWRFPARVRSCVCFLLVFCAAVSRSC